MKLQVKYVRDHGELKKERLILKALNNTNVGGYLISDTTYHDDNEVSNELRHVFWIPDKTVTQGDLIVIYTKTGKDKTIKNESGKNTHFFYWNLEHTVWNKGGDAAVLFEISDWTFKQT